MQTAINEPSWSRLVRAGSLDKAYDLYVTYRGRGYNSSALSFVNRVLFGYWYTKLLIFIIRPIVRLFLRYLTPDDGYTSADLSEAFLLFWKSPDSNGRVLFNQIFRAAISRRTVPVRCLIWLAHWLVFQGAYREALWLFRKTEKFTLSDDVLRGEWLCLFGNYLFIRGFLSLAQKRFEECHAIASRKQNTFMTMFNLGIWVFVAAKRGELQSLEEIMSHFDSLRPDEPDERYGLRLLAASAYLQFKFGNPELGNRYWHSATAVMERSGSALDRCIYFIFKSLIDILSSDQELALEDLDRAEKELGKFGTYKYYAELIRGLRDQFTDAVDSVNDRNYSFRYPKILQGFLGLGKKHSPERIRIASGSWYRQYFEVVLPLFEDSDSMEIEELMSVLKEQTLAGQFEYSSRMADEPCHEVFKISLSNSGAQFHFNLIHRGRECLIDLMSPFLPWRNRDVFVALKSMVISLQASSFREFKRKREGELQMQLTTASLARQVAHDIRSPLSALSVVIHRDCEIGIEQRNLMKLAITRINGIASDLLAKSRGQVLSVPNRESSSNRTVCYEEIIDEVIAAKRLEYGDNMNVQIQVTHCRSQSLIPQRVSTTILYVILSNLLNNSLQAIEGVGFITIESNLVDRNRIAIFVRDSGVGMEKHTLERVRVGGGTFNKPDGNGLGVKHALRWIKEWQGSIEFTSEPNRGTTVYLELPVRNDR